MDYDITLLRYYDIKSGLTPVEKPASDLGSSGPTRAGGEESIMKIVWTVKETLVIYKKARRHLCRIFFFPTPKIHLWSMCMCV